LGDGWIRGIPGLLEPVSNDAADLVIGFRSYGQMPFYRRFGRAVLDGAIDADGAVFDALERMFEHIAKEINLLS